MELKGTHTIHATSAADLYRQLDDLPDQIVAFAQIVAVDLDHEEIKTISGWNTTSETRLTLRLEWTVE